MGVRVGVKVRHAGSHLAQLLVEEGEHKECGEDEGTEADGEGLDEIA